MRVTMETEPMNQLHIGTRCKTVDEFVDVFRHYVDGNSIFVSSLGTQPPGLETVFVVLLADGSPVLRGRCVVRKAWATADNQFRLPGLLLGLKTLTLRSKAIFERLKPVTAELPSVPEVEAVIRSERPTWIGPPIHVPPPARRPTITIPPLTRPATSDALVELHRPLGRKPVSQRTLTTPPARPETTRPYPLVSGRTATALPNETGVAADRANRHRGVSAWGRWRTGAAVGLLLLVPAAFIGGQATSSAAPHPISPALAVPRVVTNATILIDGTPYAVHLVLTPIPSR